MDLSNIIGLGIAGNFAGHLEQAGESQHFQSVSTGNDKPKGIFPYYLPESDSPLSVYPYSADTQKVPGNERAQLEPEIVLLCDISYSDGQVDEIKPVCFRYLTIAPYVRKAQRKYPRRRTGVMPAKG